MNRFIIKNTGGSVVFVTDLGLAIPASGQYELLQDLLWRARDSTDLSGYVTAGTLVISDGTIDFDTTDGLNYLQNDLVSSSLLEFSSFTSLPDITATTASTLQLTKASKRLIIFTGTTSGQIIRLPEATTLLKTGRTYEIHNNSTQNISVQYYGGTALIVLKPNQRGRFVVQDISTSAGIWSYILYDNQFGGTQGVARYVIAYGFDGTASTGRWLELVTNVPSDATPYVCAEPCAIKALSLATANIATTTIQITKNGTTNVIASLSQVSARTSYSANLNIPLVAGDTLSAKASSGSSSKPTIFVSLMVTG